MKTIKQGKLPLPIAQQSTWFNNYFAQHFWQGCAVLLIVMNFSTTSVAQDATGSLQFDSVIVNNLSDCNFIVELTDTNIQSFEIGLGSERNTTNVLLLEIDFDNAGNLPSGITYARSGPLITLSIGQRPRLDYYYGQVRVKNAQGQWGEPYRFLQN
jgi:hypothetical protein